jgi:hypothetical protein
MNILARYFLAMTLVFCSASSFAIYKCEERGKVIYSDEPCSSGKVKLVETTNSHLSEPALNEAKARSKREKETLQQLEKERHKDEVIEEKARQKRMRANDALRKKCEALALKQKWSEEDAAAARGKSAEKLKRNAVRQQEQYTAECGKR